MKYFFLALALTLVSANSFAWISGSASCTSNGLTCTGVCVGSPPAPQCSGTCTTSSGTDVGHPAGCPTTITKAIATNAQASTATVRSTMTDADAAALVKKSQAAAATKVK